MMDHCSPTSAQREPCMQEIARGLSPSVARLTVEA